MKKNTAIIIPSRYESKRFPGKPLAKIKGISLIERVWRIAKKVKNADEVIIATDNKDIYNHCRSFGSKVFMTPETCKNGTERVAFIAKKEDLNYDYLVNFQGDAVLTPEWIIEDTIKEITGNNNIKICTPAVKMNENTFKKLLDSKSKGIISGTTVTFSKSKKALYFSKTVIPFIRNKVNNDLFVYKHIGLYAYKKEILLELVNTPPSILEQTEGLEQLRALENDIPINIVIVDYKGRTAWSVDNPEDIEIVEKIINDEGDILDL